MSYRDHYEPPRPGDYRKTVVHSWREFTTKRLEWLYGPGRENTTQSIADRASWRNLGRRPAA